MSSYVNLSRRSGANLFGLCPFHNEKTPSFCVSPDKQIY
ncbi:MAG: CHC2 zinc finger domain-containing protein, partial [Oscillospiraceae bacterium]|nr:CHC2 zinc finger domain-containing protein [Oscillospiraceae bacterium]